MCATGSGRIFYCACQNNGCKQTHTYTHTHRPFVKRARCQRLCSGPPSLSAPWDGSLITIPRAELLLLFSCRRSQAKKARVCSLWAVFAHKWVGVCLSLQAATTTRGWIAPTRSPSCRSCYAYIMIASSVFQPWWDSDTLLQSVPTIRTQKGPL